MFQIIQRKIQEGLQEIGVCDNLNSEAIYLKIENIKIRHITSIHMLL